MMALVSHPSTREVEVRTDVQGQPGLPETLPQGGWGRQRMDEAGHFTLPVLFLMGTIQCGSRELCPPRQEPRVQGDHRVGSFGGEGGRLWEK